MKQPIFFSIILLTILGSCSKKVSIEEPAQDTEIPVPASVEKKPYTSTHIFEATLKNVEFYVCNAFTSACPKTCGASGDYARFEVTGYQTFLVNGEGGREQLTTFALHLSNYYKIDYESNYVKFIRNLKKGDRVKFYVDYVYDPTQPVVFTDMRVLGFEKK
jgi:hypothetical protein